MFTTTGEHLCQGDKEHHVSQPVISSLQAGDTANRHVTEADPRGSHTEGLTPLLNLRTRPTWGPTQCQPTLYLQETACIMCKCLPCGTFWMQGAEGAGVLTPTALD